MRCRAGYTMSQGAQAQAPTVPAAAAEQPAHAPRPASAPIIDEAVVAELQAAALKAVLAKHQWVANFAANVGRQVVDTSLDVGNRDFTFDADLTAGVPLKASRCAAKRGQLTAVEFSAACHWLGADSMPAVPPQCWRIS